MPTQGRPRIVVRLEPELLAEVKAAAQELSPVGGLESDISTVVRHALTAWLQFRRRRATSPPPPPLEVRKRPGRPRARRPRTLEEFLSAAMVTRLKVERNSRHVRDVNKVRETIEAMLRRRFHVDKLQANEYRLTAYHDTDDELDAFVDDMLADAEDIAEKHQCYTEAEVYSLEDPKRTW